MWCTYVYYIRRHYYIIWPQMVKLSDFDELTGPIIIMAVRYISTTIVCIKFEGLISRLHRARSLNNWNHRIFRPQSNTSKNNIKPKTKTNNTDCQKEEFINTGVVGLARLSLSMPSIKAEKKTYKISKMIYDGFGYCFPSVGVSSVSLSSCGSWDSGKRMNGRCSFPLHIE